MILSFIMSSREQTADLVHVPAQNIALNTDVRHWLAANVLFVATIEFHARM